MSTLYNKAIKQQQMLRRDLEKLSAAPEDSPLSLLGQISATLASFTRTVDAYSEAASHEVEPDRITLANERAAGFRAEISGARDRFRALKAQREESAAASRREELFSRRGTNGENPFDHGGYQTAGGIGVGRGSGTSFGQSGGLLGNRSGGPSSIPRSQGLMRENDVLGTAGRQLDELLEQGRMALGDISSQNQLLQGTQQTMLKVASTMGISRETVARVERRVKGDKVVFYGGMCVLAVSFYLILRWLR